MGESHAPDGLGGSARDRALRGLVDQGVLTTEQAAAVHNALAEAEPGRTGLRWAEITGYVGAGLVLVGAFVLATATWDDLSRAWQVAVLAVVTAALLAGGVGVAGGPRALGGRSHRVPTVRRRITGALLALAAATSALGINVLTEEDTMLAGGAAGLVVAVAGYVVLPSAVGVVACWAMSVLLVGSVVDVLRGDAYDQALAGALAFLALGVLWGALAGLGALDHRRLGLGLGAGIALAGVQHQLVGFGETVFAYVLTLLVAALLLVYYQWERAGVLLVFGILAITIAVPEMVWDLTDGEVGAAAVLLIAGAVLLGASWAGIRMHQARQPDG